MAIFTGCPAATRRRRVQFRMLTTAGFDTDTAVGGLTAFSLLGVGGLLVLPLFALPAILAGARRPARAGAYGPAGPGRVRPVRDLRRDRAAHGRAAGDTRARGAEPVEQGLAAQAGGTGLDQRLLAERDTIRAVLGSKWRQAVLLTAGRLGFDYGCLLAALRATGAEPRPSLVLLAYAAAGILATPYGTDRPAMPPRFTSVHPAEALLPCLTGAP